MRALHRGLVVVFCSFAIFAIARAAAVATAGPIPEPRSVTSNSLDPHPAPAPQLALAAPTAVAGPTTVHAPSFTRVSAARPALRGLPGSASHLLIPTRPARHLADTPLLI